jgi:hypothetical protein
MNNKSMEFLIMFYGNAILVNVCKGKIVSFVFVFLTVICLIMYCYYKIKSEPHE